MPKQVWKCEYCVDYGTKEEIEEHEKGCNFNPEHMKCHSCENEKYYKGTFACMILPFAEFCEIKSSNKPCSKWRSIYEDTHEDQEAIT